MSNQNNRSKRKEGLDGVKMITFALLLILLSRKALFFCFILLVINAFRLNLFRFKGLMELSSRSGFTKKKLPTFASNFHFYRYIGDA